MALGDMPIPDQLPPSSQSVFDLLHAIGKLLDDYFKLHPGVYDTVVGGIALLVFTPLVIGFLRLAQDQIRQFMAWLGGKPGFTKLALRAYRQEVAARYGTLRNIYLGKEESLALRDVFVPLTVIKQEPSTGLGENQTTQQILTDPQKPKLVLLGAPGSGKSTLLKALATGVSRGESEALKTMIPVFLSLRSYAQGKQEKALFDWLAEVELPDLRLRNTKALLQTLLDDNRVLLMLDGLDEVPVDRLPFLRREIDGFIEAHPGNRILLTCREQNYEDMDDSGFFHRLGFEEYRVANLRNAQIRDLVRRRAGDFKRCNKSMPRYLEQVFQEDILPLHRNPLLLTLSMGVYLHRPGEEIPHNLAEFYHQAIDNLLRRHDFREIDNIPANHFKAKDKFALLRYFALGNLNAATEQAKDFESFSFTAIATAARELAGSGVVDFKASEAEEVVKEIRLQAGLLETSRDGQLYLFSHRSLNEYCAAAELIRLHEQGYQLILTQLDKEAWKEVVRLYCATDDPNAVRLVMALQASTEAQPARLAFTGHCAALLAEPRPQLRLEIFQALHEALLFADPAHGPALLKSLLDLGNSRDESIRTELDKTLRLYVALVVPEKIAQEVGRVEPAVALRFLGFLAQSGDYARQEAALQGLRHIDSEEKIPLLWKLLHQLPIELHQEAIHQLLNLLGEKDAVELLNVSDPISPPVDNEMRQWIAKAYPFLTEKHPVTPLAWLLGYAPKIRTYPYLLNDGAWAVFFEYCWKPKNEEEMRAWQRLPKDKDKWTPKLLNIRIGRLLYGLPLLFGLLFCQIVALENPSSSTDKLLASILLVIVIALVSGLLVTPCWLLWQKLLLAKGNMGSLAVFPDFMVKGLASYQLQGGVGRKIILWCWASLRRITVFVFAPVLIFLALYLHNPYLTGHAKPVYALALNKPGTQLISRSTASLARLWDAASGKELQRCHHEGTDYTVAYAPDGKTVLTGSDDNTARLWDAASGEELLRLQHEDRVYAVAYAPDGKTVLTGSLDKTARLWDAANGKELLRLQHEDMVDKVAYAPDGKTVLTRSADNTARLWDAISGKELQRFHHEVTVYTVAYAPDGKTVLTGSGDDTARLWDAASGKELQRLQHEHGVSQVAYAPDGKTVLTGSLDKTARLWDAASGKELLRLQHEGPVYAVAFSPDGQTVYTAGEEGIIRAWEAETGHLRWQTPHPFWEPRTWNSWSILYWWLLLVFIVYFLPCLKWFDRGRVWYPLGKPNRYLPLYDIPGVQRWLPPEEPKG